MDFSLTPPPHSLVLQPAAHYTPTHGKRPLKKVLPAFRRGAHHTVCERTSSSRTLEVCHVLFSGPDGGVFGLLGLALILQPPLGVYRRPAAVGCGRDRLTVARVGDVARGEHTGHARHGVLLLQDVTTPIHFDLPLEEGGRRSVADGRKEAVYLDGLLLAGLGVLYTQPLDGVL